MEAMSLQMGSLSMTCMFLSTDIGRQIVRLIRSMLFTLIRGVLPPAPSRRRRRWFLWCALVLLRLRLVDLSLDDL
jgi:hypothetical protein